MTKTAAEMLEEQAEARRQDDLEESIDDLVASVAKLAEWAVMLRRGSRVERSDQVDALVKVIDINVDTIRTAVDAAGDTSVHALVGADE